MPRALSLTLLSTWLLAPGAVPQDSRPARSPHGERRNVAVLVFDGVELLDFAGPVEAFTQAGGWDPPFRVFTVAAEKRAVRTGNVVTVVPDFAVDDCPPPDILVIPGGEVACLEGDTPLARFIRTQAPRVEVVFSVCNGAFALAGAGLLDGLEATTHWTAIRWLREAAPRTTVHADRRFVDNGQVVTAAGVSAGIDGALHLIGRLAGPRVATSAARRMEYRWEGAAAEAAPPGDRVERARLLWRAEDWKAAADEYRAIVAEHPDDAVALERLGTCLLFTRQNDEALATLERAAPAAPEVARVHEALGIARGRAGRHAAAVEAFTRARSLDPESPALLQSLGLAQAEAGLHRDAVANIEHALRLGRGDQRTRVRLAKSQLALGDPDGALATLARLREPLSADVRALLADPAFDSVRVDPRFPEASRSGAASQPASGPAR